ncbi:MAG: hypothetical protein P1U89_15880 [Verrucomicrobiales bacterium]|nr:hypothetical protein [Verrucomicrobiales bacterium]
MNSNFWNSQNIIILSVGMLAIPTGAAAGLYLLKKSNSTKDTPPPYLEENVYIEKKEEFKKVEDLEVHDHDHDHETDHEPEEVASVAPIKAIAVSEKAVVVEEEPTPEPEVKEPVTVVEKPVVIQEKKVVEKIVEAKPKADPEQVSRLLGRISQATEESNLHDHYTELRDAFENATVLERIHNVSFNLKNLHLDHRDETYLVSAMQNSAAMRKFRNHPNAKIMILGYASKDNDPRNNRFALNRAKSTEHMIHEHEKIFGFEGPIKSWCIGETESLSLETDEVCLQQNRAAEIWLIVSDHEVFDEVESDNFTKTTVKDSHHGHDDHH